MKIKSESRFIEISILQRSYPESTDFEDANWLESEIKIDVPGFHGLYGTNLRTEDFERFYNDLEMLRKNQSSEIKFTTMEEGLYLQGILSVTGKIKWSGIAKTSWGESCLTFVIETDYSLIDELLIQIHEILIKYPVIGIIG